MRLCIGNCFPGQAVGRVLICWCDFTADLEMLHRRIKYAVRAVRLYICAAVGLLTSKFPTRQMPSET